MSLIDFKNPKTMVSSFLMLLVGIALISTFTPTILEYFANLSAALAGIPLIGNFFASGGLVYLLYGVGVLLAIFGAIGFSSKSKR